MYWDLPDLSINYEVSLIFFLNSVLATFALDPGILIFEIVSN